MNDDELDRELGRMRSGAVPTPVFPAQRLWSSISPAVAARARTHRRLRGAGVLAFGMAAFFGGWVTRGGERLAVGEHPQAGGDTVASFPLAIQQVGAACIAQLAAARSAVERGGTTADAARQVRGVAVAILTGAAAEVARMAPHSAPLDEMVRLGALARRELDVLESSDAR